MRASSRWVTAFLILVKALLGQPALACSGKGGAGVSEGIPAFDLVVQSVQFSTHRLVDGGEVRVRVTVRTPSDVQPRSCSGEMWATGTFIGLAFSSCSARRIGPSRYELVLKREFPTAVVNRAFVLGSLVLSGGAGERYVSQPQPAQKLEVISTAVVPDLANPRVELRSESGERRIRAGDRFRIDLYVDSATLLEFAGFSLNLFPRDGRGVDSVRLLVRGEGDPASGWIERVERHRQLLTRWLTVYARVPHDLRGITKLEVGDVSAMNQSLQYVHLRPTGLELGIEE